MGINSGPGHDSVLFNMRLSLNIEVFFNKLISTNPKCFEKLCYMDQTYDSSRIVNKAF